MTCSRTKGASFERDVAKLLFGELGITFKRDLRQYQESDHGDLIADNPAFPFLIECKAYASGTTCKPAWEAQAARAAQKIGMIPVVIYKFDRHPIRCRLGIDAIMTAHGAQAVTHFSADLCIPGFAYVARELMARNAEQAKWSST